MRGSIRLGLICSVFAAAIARSTSVQSRSSNSGSSSYEPNKGSFSLWMLRHGKQYSSPEEEARRLQIWLQNIGFVNSINAANLTWYASVDNQFGDLTRSEFEAAVLMPPTILPTAEMHVGSNTYKIHSITNKYSNNTTAVFDSASSSPPAAFDWRDYGAVTEVQDQGSVGTCWAFSTIGNIEGQWFLSREELVDLSEEFLVDCDGTADFENSHADCSVFGGWPYLAYQFVITAGGVPTEEAYPYCAGTGDCYPCMQGPISLCGLPPYYCDEDTTAACPSVVPYASIDDWLQVGTSEELDILPALLELGPLSALLDATQLQFYAGGVWDGKVSPDAPDILGCSSSYLDHAVLIVGYGDENTDINNNKNNNCKGSSNGKEETGSAYWTVKNSWGASWGEDGYFRIARNQGTCGINTAITSSLLQRS